MHTLVQKQVPVQRKDVHSAASIHDLSSESEALQRKADLVGGSAVVQRMPPYDGGAGFQTEDNSMTDDLLHPQFENLFTPDSITYCNTCQPQPRGGWDYCTHGAVYHWLTSNNHENRRQLKYNRTFSFPLNRFNLLTWLQGHAEEHMYVHCDDTIHAASRNGRKKPHPTLVGGDPVVKGAGTMEYDQIARTITITNDSGHFLPDDIDNDTVRIVKNFCRGRGITVATRKKTRSL